MNRAAVIAQNERDVDDRSLDHLSTRCGNRRIVDLKVSGAIRIDGIAARLLVMETSEWVDWCRPRWWGRIRTGQDKIDLRHPCRRSAS